VNYKAKASDTLYAGESHFLKQYRSASFLRNGISADHDQYFFTGRILYPTAIRLYTLSDKPEINQLVFIDSGYQEIELRRYDSVIMLSRVPSTKVAQEHQEFLKQMGVADMEEKIPETKLEQYVKNNPASYVALFALISQTFNYNFSPALKRIASCFDASVKETKGYRYFASQYIEKREIPALDLKDKKKQNIRLNFVQSNSKYTLVEFWFTGCTACIPVMLYLKQHYKDLSGKVRIITVCTDSELQSGALKLLQRLNLPWENYWDYSAAQFGKYANLYKYPGNILIDSNGYIMSKDIDTSEIRAFISP
jgi:hypothetical protein